MMVIYREPKDLAAFDEHFFGTHVSLAKELPGLRKYEISTDPVTTRVGDWNVHLVATLYFDDIEAIRQALASPEGQAAAADRRRLAPDDRDVLILVFESRDA
jgi:uncharacterized protein (TIGR02118 family)